MTDLAGQTDRIIRTGVPGYPFVFGSLIIWPEMTPGADTIQLAAATADAGQSVPLPTELTAPLSRPAFENGDQDTYVWSANQLKSLSIWRTGEQSPRKIIDQAPVGQYLQWPQVSGSFVAWDNGYAQFVADTRSGSYTQITPQAGLLMLGPGSMTVTYAPQGPKVRHPVIDSTTVRLSLLPPLTGCAKP